MFFVFCVCLDGDVCVCVCVGYLIHMCVSYLIHTCVCVLSDKRGGGATEIFIGLLSNTGVRLDANHSRGYSKGEHSTEGKQKIYESYASACMIIPPENKSCFAKRALRQRKQRTIALKSNEKAFGDTESRPAADGITKRSQLTEGSLVRDSLEFL